MTGADKDRDGKTSPRGMKERQTDSSSDAEAGSTDEIVLTPELRQLARELGQEPPVDLAKINRIRAQLEAGTYRADPQTIAERLLELDALLPAATPANAKKEDSSDK